MTHTSKFWYTLQNNSQQVITVDQFLCYTQFSNSSDTIFSSRNPVLDPTTIETLRVPMISDRTFSKCSFLVNSLSQVISSKQKRRPQTQRVINGTREKTPTISR